MRTTAKQRDEVLGQLTDAGIRYADACALRRISMTLQRWGELECGDGNDYGSWAIERDEQTDKPYMVHHHWGYGQGKATTTRRPIADREKGALKRLSAIMAQYPGLSAYHQTDPRGAALYILRPGDVPEGKAADAYYNNGIAVY
jgi:hypothetical protein